mmetsp:Transcript_58345/g.130313  ORF Transcript_58345/g.130313 Transcript_58345/m.130313 type:complete len:128 (-) Transcript_58345:91-474(-)
MAVDSEGDVSSGSTYRHLMRNQAADDAVSSLHAVDAEGSKHEQAELLEMIPISASDVAYKAMDLMFGTTGVIEEDYPFACLCDAEGLCQNDPASTSCKGRAGQPNAACLPRSLQALLLPVLLLLRPW